VFCILFSSTYNDLVCVLLLPGTRLTDAEAETTADMAERGRSADVQRGNDVSGGREAVNIHMQMAIDKDVDVVGEGPSVKQEEAKMNDKKAWKELTSR